MNFTNILINVSEQCLFLALYKLTNLRIVINIATMLAV